MQELFWFEDAENLKDSLVQYYNCQLLQDDGFANEDLWIYKGKVIDPIEVFYDLRREPDYRVNCEGLFLSPGFIDIQINGGFGIDLSDDCPNLGEQLSELAGKLPSLGVTAFCPTIVSCKAPFYAKALAQYKKRPGGIHGAAVLGVHLEGPFISRSKSGAHDHRNIVDQFDDGFGAVEKIYGPDLSQVAYVTLAPELTNAMCVIKKLTSMGIKVSLGHTMANLSTGIQAIRCGATGLTHLFNAMRPFEHREPCLPGLLVCLEERILYYGIIADLAHCHSETLNFAYRAHPKGMVLVTDAVPAMGLDDGVQHLGTIQYEIKNGQATLTNSNTLVGGMTPLNVCIKNLIQKTNCSGENAIDCATLNPAKFLGLSHYKGRLKPSYDADFVLLDKMINVKATFIEGERVYICSK